jgi:hypothetical protein
MKVFPPTLWFLLLCSPWAMPAATPMVGVDGVAAMQAAADQGWNSFVALGLAAGRPAPSMPSRWHLANATAADQRPVEAAAAALGRTLTQQLVGLAPSLQTLPPGDDLLRQTANLCDLADWSAMSPGYGNVLITQRARDLAAVGVARLAADLDFPLAKILPLAARLHPLGPGVAERQRLLNLEAGAEIFRTADQGDLEATWATGARLLAESRQPGPRRGGGARGGDLTVLRAHLAFFQDEPPGPGEPATLAVMWDRKWHKQVVDGIESRAAAQAVALVEFRRVTGRFPLQPAVDPVAAAADLGTAAVMASARGIQLVLPVRTSPLGQRAFEQAWQLSPASAPTTRPAPDARRTAHVPILAWTAYEAVQQGEFLDHDTMSERYRK